MVSERILRYGRSLLRRGPWATPLRRALGIVRRRTFDSSAYWEGRYAAGGDSGIGSFGKLADYKAGFLNAFVERHGIESVIEFGCGDGNQLALYRFPSYLGLDVSRTAIAQCERRFAGDASKRFLVYDEALRSRLRFPAARLSLSIDVLYHLVEDHVLTAYLRDLFAAAEEYVVVYSTNFERVYETPHQVDRNFTAIIAATIPDFELTQTVENPHKGEESMSDFFVYRRVAPR